MLLNPTFQDAGATPGEAAHWGLSSHCSAQRYAAFGPGAARAVEDFERWFAFAEMFAEGGLVLAFFDPVARGFESFEAWAGSAFLESLPEVLLDACSFGGAGVDDFEGWLAGPWDARWSDVTSTPAKFGANAFDSFEAWTSPVAPVWAAATFGPALDPADAFEGGWPTLKTI